LLPKYQNKIIILGLSPAVSHIFGNVSGSIYKNYLHKYDVVLKTIFFL